MRNDLFKDELDGMSHRVHLLKAPAGTVVVFNGARLHGVHNVQSADGLPQVALAINFRSAMTALSKLDGIKLPTVRVLSPSTTAPASAATAAPLTITTSRRMEVRRGSTLIATIDGDESRGFAVHTPPVVFADKESALAYAESYAEFRKTSRAPA